MECSDCLKIFPVVADVRIDPPDEFAGPYAELCEECIGLRERDGFDVY